MLERYRYAYLLATLALLIIGRPFLPDFGRNLVIAMLALSLVTAAVTSAARQYQAWVGIALTAVIVLGYLMPQDSALFDAALVSPALGMIYWAVTALLILRRILVRTDRITADTINGAICVYLVMGLGWAQAYELLAALEPASFAAGTEVIVAAHSFDLERDTIRSGPPK